MHDIRKNEIISLKVICTNTPIPKWRFRKNFERFWWDEILKKINQMEDVKISILPNNDAKRLILEKKWPINKWTKYLFFVLNKFINCSKYIWILSEFSYIFENTVLKKKSQIITVKLLIPSSENSWIG